MTKAKDRSSDSDRPAPDLVVPRSVAVIMDGNGRWAKRAGLERIRGHERGIDAVRTTVTECARLGVEALVLYAFSEENWQRPQREIDLLFKLLRRFLVEERDTLMKNRVRLLHSGRRARLAPDITKLLDETMAIAAQIASYSLPVVMKVKEAVNRAYESSLAEGLLFERREFHATFALDDQKEGMRAFVEKRKPAFRHK